MDRGLRRCLGARGPRPVRSHRADGSDPSHFPVGEITLYDLVRFLSSQVPEISVQTIILRGLPQSVAQPRTLSSDNVLGDYCLRSGLRDNRSSAPCTLRRTRLAVSHGRRCTHRVVSLSCITQTAFQGTHTEGRLLVIRTGWILSTRGNHFFTRWDNATPSDGRHVKWQTACRTTPGSRGGWLGLPNRPLRKTEVPRVPGRY